MTGSEYSINRREMLKRAAAASFGVAAPSLIPFSGGTMTLTGLPSEYDKYDALGLAELIAKKQIAPAELLDAVRQPRLECQTKTCGGDLNLGSFKPANSSVISSRRKPSGSR